jgi:hypothetical protein
VNPGTLALQPGARGRVQLSAAGGAVDWAVTAPPTLVAWSATAGTLQDGETVVVTFQLVNDRRTPPGSRHVATFNPGGVTLTVVVL